MTEATLEEHDKYTIWISKWAELSGFGAYVTVNKKVCLHRYKSQALASPG